MQLLACAIVGRALIVLWLQNIVLSTHQVLIVLRCLAKLLSTRHILLCINRGLKSRVRALEPLELKEWLFSRGNKALRSCGCVLFVPTRMNRRPSWESG